MVTTCLANATTCYTNPANLTSITDLLSYIKNQTSVIDPTTGAQLLPLGDQVFGFSILFTLWIVLVMVLMRYDSKTAFMAASFVCWIISMPLMALGWVNGLVWGLFLILTVGSGLVVYMRDRGG